MFEHVLTEGDHGYDNSLPSMKSFFIAHGPAFKSNYKPEEQLYNVDFYALMCHLLGVSPHVNDGSFDRICHILAADCTSFFTLTMVTCE